MSDFGNKEVFSENLRRYIELSGKTRKDIISDLGFKESSFNTWCRGEYYPRIDKIEMLADYFHCTKSDLIEKQATTYVIGKEAKDALDTISMSMDRKEIVNFLLHCSDKDASILVTMVRTLKGNDDESN